MASDDEYEIPESGAVFTFGRSGFADNHPSHFFIRNDPIVEISCGDEHTAVVCKNGRVFVFGHNDYGQLGLGHKRTVTKPTCLKYLKPFHAKHVACGKGHTLVSTECGRVFSFGSNSDGQLGLGDLNDRLVPHIIKTDVFEGAAISAVSAGCLHSACLTESGELFAWGNNSDGQCGVDVDANLLVPTKIEFGNGIVAMSCGYYHTAFVSEGCLYTFGEEDNGKLGYRKLAVDNAPHKVDINFECVDVQCGGNHTLLLSAEGRAFAFGSNFSGQLGSGSGEAESYAPVRPNLGDACKIVAISAGENHSAFVTENGELFMCGDARYGKICVEEDSANYATPVAVALLRQFRCDFASCGGCHTMVVARARTEGREPDLIRKIPTLPPLKVRKTLKDDDDDDEDDALLKDEEKAEAGERADDDNDHRSTVDEVYADIEDLHVRDVEREPREESPSSRGESKSAEEEKATAEVDADVVVRSESRIKKFLNRFRRKTCAAAIAATDDASNAVDELGNAKEKRTSREVANHHGSKACVIL